MNRRHSMFMRVMVGLLAVVLWLPGAPAQAQDVGAQIPSLKWIPADAATYAAMLRGREQLDVILKSKAWARLNSLPFAKMLRQKLEDEWNNPGGSLEQVKTAYGQPGVAEVLQTLGAMFSDEAFVYVGREHSDFLVLLQELNSASQLAPLQGLLKGDLQAGDGEKRIKAVLQFLNDNADRIRLPDAVIGFKLDKAIQAKVTKALEDSIQIATLFVPTLKERLKKIKINGSEVTTLVLDGQLVPWDMIPINRVEDQPGQFNKLINHLKKLTFTVSLGMRDDYMLLGLGEGTAGLKALGQGQKLLDRPELAPITKFGDKRICSVSYISKEFNETLTGGPWKVDETVRWVKELLKDTDLTAAQKAKIEKDIKELIGDMERYVPKPGAKLNFSFLTQQGSEGYSYDWSKNQGIEATKALTILNHLGGQPLAFGAGQSRVDIEGYESLVKWLKRTYEYFEEYGLPRIPSDDARDKIQAFMKQARPLFARLDKATGKMLLPSIDGQVAILLDAKLKINVPLAENPLPMPELALAIGLRDADLFKQACKEYREVINGFIELAGQFAPGGPPEFRVPAATSTKGKLGTLYYYPVPEIPGLDPKIVPTAGISENLAAFTLSHAHAERLLVKTPLKIQDGPIANVKRPLASAAYLNWAGLVTAASPWIEQGLKIGRQGDEVIEQVQVVLEILKTCRGVSSITYVEQGAVVTHSESIFRDLEK